MARSAGVPDETVAPRLRCLMLRARASLEIAGSEDCGQCRRSVNVAGASAPDIWKIYV